MAKKSIGIIVCPECKSVSVNRKREKCRSCGTTLYFAGDYMTDMEGYIGDGLKWTKVKDLLDSTNH